MRKRVYHAPTVKLLAFAVEEVLGPSDTNPPELPDHDWVSYTLPKVELEEGSEQ